jgi:aminopeptidase N
VAHQWWGSLITNSNFRNYWFVESLAEYSSALYSEAVFGKKAYYDHVEDWRQEILDAELPFSVQDATVLAGGWRDYRAAVYAKGPYMFHVMRSTWGDEQFFKYLRQMAGDLAGMEIVSRDIQRSAEKALGGEMGWFFDQWLRGIGMPEYTFTYDTRQTEDGMYLIEGTVEQRILQGRKKRPVEGEAFVAVVPVTVEVKGGAEIQKKLVLEGPLTRFAFKVADEPKDVTFNKYGESLAYDVIVKKGSSS